MPAVVRIVPFRYQLNLPQRETYDLMRSLSIDDQHRITDLVRRAVSILASLPRVPAAPAVERVAVPGAPHLTLVRSPSCEGRDTH